MRPSWHNLSGITLHGNGANRCVCCAAGNPDSARVSVITMAALFIAALSTALARAEDRFADDERFVAGLRERRLYRLAETFSESQLAASDIAPERRARLVVEYSRTLAAHAVETSPDLSDALWQKASDVCDRFAETFAGTDLALLVSIQQALVSTQRGELLRERAKISAVSDTLFDQARASLRLGIDRLERALAALETQLRRTPRRPAGRDVALNKTELDSLRKHIEFQLARAIQNQGRTFAPGSADRADALARAAERFGPLAELRGDDALVWRSRLELIVSLRLLGNLDAARRRIALFEAGSPPEDLALRCKAEGIRLALAAGDDDDALSLADSAVDSLADRSGDLALAILETYLTAWRRASDLGNAQTAGRRQTQAQNIVRRMETAYGGYWFRRAESKLAATLVSDNSTGNIDLLVQAAESYYRGGQFDQAVGVYDRAQRLAREMGKEDKAFDLAYVAAAIEHEREHHELAAERYAAMAIALPGHDRASDAHLLAIFNAGQLARNDSSPEALDRYIKLLKEHLELWPVGPSAEEARLRLAKIYEHRQQWPEAIEAYRGLSSDGPHADSAIEGLIEGHNALLAGRERQGLSIARHAGRAVRDLDHRASMDSPAGSKSASVLRAALAAAQIRVRYLPHELDRAELALNEIVRSEEQASALSQKARAWLMVALAGQGKQRQAEALVEGITDLRADELTELLEALSAHAGATARTQQRQIAALLVPVAEAVLESADGLSATAIRRAALIQADALATLGEEIPARAIYDDLASEYPRDPDVLEPYAALLLAAGDSSSLESALSLWRQLARHSKNGSSRWLRAKYHVAETHFQLGQRDQAEKIVALTQVLHPNLGGPTLKAKFLDLASRCQR